MWDGNKTPKWKCRVRCDRLPLCQSSVIPRPVKFCKVELSSVSHLTPGTYEHLLSEELAQAGYSLHSKRKLNKEILKATQNSFLRAKSSGILP